jgi:hypothetical protein
MRVSNFLSMILFLARLPLWGMGPCTKYLQQATKNSKQSPHHCTLDEYRIKKYALERRRNKIFLRRRAVDDAIILGIFQERACKGDNKKIPIPKAAIARCLGKKSAGKFCIEELNGLYTTLFGFPLAKIQEIDHNKQVCREYKVFHFPFHKLFYALEKHEKAALRHQNYSMVSRLQLWQSMVYTECNILFSGMAEDFFYEPNIIQAIEKYHQLMDKERSLNGHILKLEKIYNSSIIDDWRSKCDIYEWLNREGLSEELKKEIAIAEWLVSVVPDENTPGFSDEPGNYKLFD